MYDPVNAAQSAVAADPDISAMLSVTMPTSTPEQNLVCAMILQAVDDIRLYRGSSGHRHLRDPAIEWVKYDGPMDVSGRIRFADACDALGMDASAVREGILNLVGDDDRSTERTLRRCDRCGQDMFRRTSETFHAFALRRTCSRACGLSLFMKENGPRGVCKRCGGELPGHRFRRYCSQECRLDDNRAYKWIPRECVVCSGVFAPRRRPSGDLEPKANFLIRRTCSQVCAGKLAYHSEYRRNRRVGRK